MGCAILILAAFVAYEASNGWLFAAVVTCCLLHVLAVSIAKEKK